MADGIVARYKNTGVPPPDFLYTDRDCCPSITGRPSKVMAIFSTWPKLIVRMDVWHFMRRLAKGCETEMHLLYGKFMRELSVCIFGFSESDTQKLVDAKRSQRLF